MNELKPPKSPWERSSTCQLGGEFAKRLETPEDQDSSGDDFSRLAQMKWELKLEKDGREKKQKSLCVLKETRKRLRLYCCFCEKNTGINRNRYKACEHQRGIRTEYWSMVLLTLFFGIFSGIFIILRSFFASRIVRGTDSSIIAIQDLLVSSILLLIRGITTITSGFAGKAIVEIGEETGIRPGYVAGKWKPLITYVGTMIRVASLGVFALFETPRITSRRKEMLYR